MQHSLHFGAAEHSWHVLGGFCANRVDCAKFQAKHIAVQEKQSAERLVLSRGENMIFYGLVMSRFI